MFKLFGKKAPMVEAAKKVVGYKITVFSVMANEDIVIECRTIEQLENRIAEYKHSNYYFNIRTGVICK